MKIFLWCSPHLDLLIIWIHQTKSCYVGSGIFKILQIHQMKILNMMLYFLFDNMSTERRLIGNSDGWRLMEWIFLGKLILDECKCGTVKVCMESYNQAKHQKNRRNRM